MQNVYHTKLGPGRRFALPAEICERFGIKTGDPVTVEVRDNDLRVVPLQQVIKEVQEAFRPFRDPSKSIVDELIADRRAEVGDAMLGELVLNNWLSANSFILLFQYGRSYQIHRSFR